MRILNRDQVRAAISMSEAIKAVREGFIALSTGKATIPLRSTMSVPDGLMLYMPAHAQGSPSTSVKVVGVFGKNPARHLPTVSATVLLIDAVTGQPQALMDGTYLTTLRTGAASGVATDLLAREDSEILGVIGAGAQAITQIAAICAVRPIREIRVYARRGADQFVKDLIPVYPGVLLRAVNSPQEALRGADILVAATTSSTPVIQSDDVAPGVHINGVGSYTPHMQEVAAEVVIKSRIVVDSRESAFEEAGDLLIPIAAGTLDRAAVDTEIGEIAAGLKPGRTAPDEITFFKSVGVAIQDLVVASRIYALAESQNIGMVVNL